MQEGRKRVKDSLEVLQEVAGPCYPLLFLKLGVSPWTPVGSEMLWKVLPGKEGTGAVVICDSDGNGKAMSTWMTQDSTRACVEKLSSRGIGEFSGEVKLPL